MTGSATTIRSPRVQAVALELVPLAAIPFAFILEWRGILAVVIVALVSGLGWWRIGHPGRAVAVLVARGAMLVIAAVFWVIALLASICFDGPCDPNHERLYIIATVVFALVFVGSVLWSAIAVARYKRKLNTD